MSIEGNKAVLRRLYEEVRNKGNVSVIPEIIAPDFVYHSSREVKGPEGFKENTLMWRNAFPDLRRTILEMVGEGETVVARVLFRGTFKGKLGNVEPTGKVIEYELVYFWRFRNGMIVEGTPFANMLIFWRQAGVNLANLPQQQ